MTQLLEKAYTEISRLTPSEQDVIASVILDEIIEERKWTESFLNTQDELSILAAEALKELKDGNTKPISF
jgi:hypothetical protein